MALLLTPGNIADISAAPGLLAAMPPARRLIADKGYDANNLRGTLGAQGTEAVHRCLGKSRSVQTASRPTQ